MVFGEPKILHIITPNNKYDTKQIIADSSYERSSNMATKMFQERPIKVYQQASSDRKQPNHTTQTKLLSPCKPSSLPSTTVHPNHSRSHKVYRSSGTDNPAKRTVAKPKIPLRNLPVLGQKNGCFEFNGV